MPAMHPEGDETDREQPQQDQPFDADSDPAPEGKGDLGVEPGQGGYGERDPKTEMPKVPSVPDTQTGAEEHGGEPPQSSGDRPASS